MYNMENMKHQDLAVLPGFLEYMHLNKSIFPKINYVIMDNRLKDKNKFLCPICYEYKSNSYGTKECNHKFCYNCLAKWSKLKKECPCCRKKFENIFKLVKIKQN